ncbi:aspartate dehydrogenase [Woeseia oceani]|uniref:L-aspartate dehydrogenase n=1 Tax=Woeseia oceani TaxID=1548547 RepID=A0A193LDJ2_9GAMM|nr:aspartate dehydrogenase [Woeseia oceani]ANO50548.1 aspartate dehydrogenase [Woeseia oceani]
MNIAIIGVGAIGSYVCDKLVEQGHTLRAILLPPQLLQNGQKSYPGTECVASVANLPDDIDHMIDCAGHTALRTHGPDILRRGTALTTVSIGALADPDLYRELEQAATEGNTRLHLASGAIGALDCLRAARVGSLQSVTYIGRKPPLSWKGSLADKRLDLDNLKAGAEVHFEGSARLAATEYPKNANVAAAVALAGIGFDLTQVKLIADPGVFENVHEIQAVGDFGRFSFEIRGRSLPDNPKSSALAAMSVVSRLAEEAKAIGF